ncbi:metallophosphoesterase family protein [Aeromonas media]|uniref:metallophosphoesterase family protein n=1 Tax=Aeromonas media TaxID=651 RepID=UPI003D1F67C5
MVSKKLALRFRDAQNGIDTITEHLNVLTEEKSVWWGWWKKDHEDIDEETLDFIKTIKGNITLINRENTSFHSAFVEKAIFNDEMQKNLSSRIPTYYRDNSSNVYAWFLLSKITPKKYNKSLDRQFSENNNPTYVISSSKRKNKPINNANRAELHKNSILLLSDLHFGDDYSHELSDSPNSLSNIIYKDLASLSLQDDISTIIITGDITTHGNWSQKQMSLATSELHFIAKKLNVEHSNIIVCPGNHDIVRYPKDSDEYNIEQKSISNQQNNQHERDFRLFRDSLNGKNWQAPLNQNQKYHINNLDVDIDIITLNSCAITATKWSEYGYVGRQGIDTIIDSNKNQNSTKKKYKILALHHHILPTNDLEQLNHNGISMTIDAVEILNKSIVSNINLIVHGHQHFFHATEYVTYNRYSKSEDKKSIKVLSNGSIGVKASRRANNERQSYAIVTFNIENVEITARELTGNNSNCVSIVKLYDDYLI